MANDLDLTLIPSATSNNQHQAANDSVTKVANATQDIMLVDFTAHATLSTTDFRTAFLFKPSGALAAARNLTIAAVKRAQFMVHNSDATYTISVIKGSTTIAVAPGKIGIFYTDGTTNSLVGATLDASAVTYLRPDATANLTAGYTATAYNAGTKTTGTFTPDPANGNLQRAVNGGAHTLAPASVGGGNAVSMVIQYTNDGSAGTITTSGFTKVTGDSLTTTNGHDFLFNITVINGFSHLNVVALQ